MTFNIGDKVVRGPTWEYPDYQDSAGKCVGIVIGLNTTRDKYFVDVDDEWYNSVRVKWDNDHRNVYRTGRYKDVVKMDNEPFKLEDCV